MKLGIAETFPHTSPQEWAQSHSAYGLSSVVFPCTYTDDLRLIDQYVVACQNYGLQIAEVGAWRNLLALDRRERKANFDYCKGQLELAEYIGAACCVNIAGAKGEIWDGPYAENYSQKAHDEIIESVQNLLDSVRPQKTFYTLEPMPWMLPDTPEAYLDLIQVIDRPAFAVHMDMVNMINEPKKYLFCKEVIDHAFDLLGNFIKSCHLKDVKLSSRLTLHLAECTIGSGGFNICHYLDRIRKLPGDVPVIIEHLSTKEEYIRAISYFKHLEGETI